MIPLLNVISAVELLNALIGLCTCILILLKLADYPWVLIIMNKDKFSNIHKMGAF